MKRREFVILDDDDLEPFEPFPSPLRAVSGARAVSVDAAAPWVAMDDLDGGLGLRALLAHPEALSPRLRRLERAHAT